MRAIQMCRVSNECKVVQLCASSVVQCHGDVRIQLSEKVPYLVRHAEGVCSVLYV